jgi:hypothetical protein
MIVKFLGYHQKEQGWYVPEFEIRGHSGLPDGSIVNWEFLQKTRINIPDRPSYFEWRQNQYKQKRGLI